MAASRARIARAWAGASSISPASLTMCAATSSGSTGGASSPSSLIVVGNGVVLVIGIGRLEHSLDPGHAPPGGFENLGTVLEPQPAQLGHELRSARMVFEFERRDPALARNALDG